MRARAWRNSNGVLSFMVSRVDGVGCNSDARRRSGSTTPAGVSILNPVEETILALSLLQLGGGIKLVREMGLGCGSGI